MPAIRTRHSYELEKLVAVERQKWLEALVNTPDLRTAGVIGGLDLALKLSEEADYIISGEESVSS